MRMSCGGAGACAGKIIGANEGFEGVVTGVWVATGTAAIRAAGFISALRSQYPLQPWPAERICQSRI
jgi:hypothetical protein